MPPPGHFYHIHDVKYTAQHWTTHLDMASEDGENSVLISIDNRAAVDNSNLSTWQWFVVMHPDMPGPLNNVSYSRVGGNSHLIYHAKDDGKEPAYSDAVTETDCSSST